MNCRSGFGSHGRQTKNNSERRREHGEKKEYERSYFSPNFNFAQDKNLIQMVSFNLKYILVRSIKIKNFNFDLLVINFDIKLINFYLNMVMFSQFQNRVNKMILFYHSVDEFSNNK